MLDLSSSLSSIFLLNSLLESVRRPDKMATDTTMPKGKYTESQTFSLHCIYADYGELGKPSLHHPELRELTKILSYIVSTL